MNYPPTTPLNHHLMTSKLRFLCDGTESVRLSCRFWRLSYPFHALFGALKPPLALNNSQDDHAMTTTSVSRAVGLQNISYLQKSDRSS
jgi:hypothetical protein